MFHCASVLSHSEHFPVVLTSTSAPMESVGLSTRSAAPTSSSSALRNHVTRCALLCGLVLCPVTRAVCVWNGLRRIVSRVSVVHHR